jgi:hypothetical protein
METDKNYARKIRWRYVLLSLSHDFLRHDLSNVIPQISFEGRQLKNGQPVRLMRAQM